MAILCNNKELPVTIAFNHGNEDKTFHVLYPSAHLVRKNSLIEIYEGLKTGVKFYVDAPEHFDENASIEIQSSIYNESTDTQETFVFPLSDKPEINWMFQSRDDEIFPWRMGTYLIKIHYLGQSYTLGIFVKPLYLSVEQVHTVHDYLESKIEGIIYDLVYSNKSLSDVDNILNNWYYDYARYMMNQKESILFYLYSLEKQPVANLIGSNEVSSIQGQLNRKSIQWSQTSKGMSKNSGSSVENYFYNRVKNINYNLKENQWIKNILLKWSSEINHVLEVISSSYASVQKELKNLKNNRIELEKRKFYLNQRRDVARTTKIDVFAQITITDQNIQKNTQIASQQESWIIHIRSIYSRIIHLLNNSFFSVVERGTTKPVLKSNSYYQLNTLYDNSKKIERDQGDKERYIKVYKPFWQIYEYYCLFSVIDGLIKMGFNVKRGLEQNLFEQYHQSLIKDGSCIVLESETAVVHCWYDKYHGDIFTAQENGDQFYTGQEKKRPDIKLDLYEKQEDGSLLFRSCLIFDAKFRKLANLHRNDYATKTYHQLISYYSFFYRGKNTNSGKGAVVKQVICLYGSERNEAVKTEVDPLLYIKLFPVIDENNKVQTRGEEELLEEIKIWLDDLVVLPGI
ncbi:hypothetical protein [Peribacillus muralis]|uniref:hypothetical protein n=1 Tax=Peribacillus muralis TaxID=264697 RepID=UPI00366C285D